MLGLLAIPLTILWVVSFENLINFSDGLDGLAAGIAGITSGAMVFAAAKAGAVQVAPEAAALAGAVFGFLPFNFHRVISWAMQGPCTLGLHCPCSPFRDW